MRRIAAVLSLVIGAGAIAGQASDRIGVYAVIDKVVFEPSAASPQRIQVWGVFAVATPADRDNYEPVTRGYLYFTGGGAAGSPGMSNAEWNDLQSVAGTRRIVGFSSRFGQTIRVRAATEKPQAPDTYVTGIGVTVMRADRDYAPIKALVAAIAR